MKLGMRKLTYLTVRALAEADAATLAHFWQTQPPEYVRFFYAFDFSVDVLAAMLRERQRDVYTGLFWHGELIGFFMLRGWDAGYQIPSFGVLIGNQYRGGTLLKLTLDLAKFIVRQSGASRMMAKIHPDNVSPRGARRLGWQPDSKEPETGNIVYYMDL